MELLPPPKYYSDKNPIFRFWRSILETYRWDDFQRQVKITPAVAAKNGRQKVEKWPEAVCIELWRTNKENGTEEFRRIGIPLGQDGKPSAYEEMLTGFDQNGFPIEAVHRKYVPGASDNSIDIKQANEALKRAWPRQPFIYPIGMVAVSSTLDSGVLER